tara:strand:- start:740 stop:1156 length:417 start_codon:yes stop_codon:yes gene_type:complete
MGMYIKNRKSKTKGVKLDLTPLVDVIFILLLFFAVSTTMVISQQGIKLTLPTAETSEDQTKGIVISVDKHQRIFLDKEEISEKIIRYKIADLKSTHKKLQVLINADRTTPYSQVMRLLDEVRLGGCFNVVLEAKKKGS